MTVQFLTTFQTSEMQALTAAVNAIDIDETFGEALHLRLFDGARQWMMENDEGQFVLWVDDPEVTVVPGQFAISERMRRFADAFADDPLSLSIVDDTTALVAAGTCTAAIDLVPQDEDEFEPWPIRSIADARVSTREFMMALWSARCMPCGIADSTYPMPPMWMEVGDSGLRLHVDWTDFLPSRATYRIDLQSRAGEATVAIPHSVIENFLRTAPLADLAGDEHTLGITIGVASVDDRERDVVRISGSGWQLVLWQVDALGSRWRSKVEEMLDGSDIPVMERGNDEWLVRWQGNDVRVKLHAGHPDVARVSAPLLTHTLESIELLRELCQLNAASNGLRYWLQDGVVRVVTDVRCTTLSALGAAVRDVAHAALTYSPMLAAFATT